MWRPLTALILLAAACGQGPSHGSAPPGSSDDAASLAAAPARALPLAALTFEDASINGDFSLNDDGLTYPRVLNGTPSAPQIVSVSPSFDGNAIRYEVPAGSIKERIEHKISQFGDADALTFGGKRYTGFAFMLDSNTTEIESSMLFFQEWQGYPYGPPVALKLTSGKGLSFTLRLAVRNMDTGADSSTPDEVIWTGALSPGVWHTFVILVAPSFDTPGEVKLWYDGTRVVDWSGLIGYDPAAVTGAYDGFDTKFGLYQPSPNNTHAVYFDDVSFAATYAAANPPSNR